MCGDCGRAAGLSTWILICAASVVLVVGTRAGAQAGVILSQRVDVNIDSGVVSATGEGAAPMIVFSRVASVEGAGWVRLYFGEVVLSGGGDARNEASLRLTSLEDGAVQKLDSFALGRWGYTSAYFNGDSVLVELLAYPQAGPNRVVIDSVTAGSQAGAGGGELECEVDTRVLSDDPRTGRLVFEGALGTNLCTGFLFDNRPRSLLTAGHCCQWFDVVGDEAVLEFNVPPSDPDGVINHPGPEDQYAVDPECVKYNCYFTEPPPKDTTGATSASSTTRRPGSVP